MQDKFVENAESQEGKPSTTLPGTVEKIIKPVHPSEPEKAQISVEGADDLYRELRIENNLKNENGERVPLKEGQTVDITIQASDSGIQKVESHGSASRV
jgi:predicted DNA-binding antitoxin AbrB/MazE fold protein